MTPICLCIFSLPQATDETLLDKLKQHHADDPLLILSPNRKTFTIQHFAGRVIYDIKVEYYCMHLKCKLHQFHQLQVNFSKCAFHCCNVQNSVYLLWPCQCGKNLRNLYEWSGWLMRPHSPRGQWMYCDIWNCTRARDLWARDVVEQKHKYFLDILMYLNLHV